MRTWVEVSKSKLCANLSRIEEHLGLECLVSPVVKANAYGHGLSLVAALLYERGVRHFSVDSLEEALSLYDMGIKCPVLIMGYIEPSAFNEMKENFVLCLYSAEVLEALIKLNRKVCVQLKLETGLNRQGVQPKDLPQC